MRTLLHSSCRLTTREAFRKCFVDTEIADGFVQIQRRNLGFDVQPGTEEAAVESEYRQL